VIQFSKEFNDNFFKNISELYIDPEIERRKQAGSLSDDFAPYAVQVIMNHDGPIEVRFNSEVSAYVVGTFAKPFSDGDEVSISDLETITDIELTDRDPNAGHVTLLIHNESWVGRFDFRYNASRSRDHLSTARQFLDAASVSLAKGHLRPMLDNLFSATELMAKGVLLLHDESMLSSKKHGRVSTRFNQWGHLGNTDPRFTGLLNKLSSLRSSARYLERELNITTEEAQDMLAVAEVMFKDTEIRVPTDRAKKEKAAGK
jgi:uncharacterized protein (UPF0332 family)